MLIFKNKFVKLIQSCNFILRLLEAVNLRRPATYNTKHADVILSYLIGRKNSYITAAQIEESLRTENIIVSRPTIYRQLEKLVSRGMVRKYLLGNSSVASFRYVEQDENEPERFRLKCEICEGVFNIECHEAAQVTGHIFESHDFQVVDTVFYGKCKACLQK